MFNMQLSSKLAFLAMCVVTGMAVPCSAEEKMPSFKPSNLRFAATTCPFASTNPFQDCTEQTGGAYRPFWIDTPGTKKLGLSLTGGVPDDAETSNPHTPLICFSDLQTKAGESCVGRGQTTDLNPGNTIWQAKFQDFEKGPGSYSGKISVEISDPGVGRIGTTVLPYTLTVKHGVLLPLIVLVFGCALAVALRWYNAEQREIDSLYAALQRIVETATRSGIPRPSSDQTGSNLSAFWTDVSEADAALMQGDMERAKAEIEAARNALITLIGQNGAVAQAYSPSEEKLPPIGDPQAVLRLRMVTLTMYAVGILGLIYAGLSALYLNDDDFGKFTDYFALVVWGFGSQATTSAVGKILASWNLPGFGRA